MSDLRTTIHNERVKLTATALNGFAIALAAVGGIAPSVSFLVGNGAGPQSSLAVAATAATCILIAAGLHLFARSYLGRMKQ